jgi:outer membrane protein TolC
VAVAATALAALAALSACATYAPLPLASRPDLARQLPDAAASPLDMTAAATIAVLNNPDLRAARATFGVAQAQAFAAGLLPDPQISYTGTFPTDGRLSASDPRYPEVYGYGLDLAVDLRALLTHATARQAAHADYRQAQLALLWQEWQTVARARTLYVQQSIAAGRCALLSRAERTYALQAQRSARAQAAGNATLEQTSADQALLVDVRARLGTAERDLLAARHGLRALLGIAPGAAIALQPLPRPVVPARSEVEQALALLPQRRPDLAALAAGYRGQEARTRLAVLSQFPDISLGLSSARDNSDIHSVGVGVSLTLPLFDRGRGQIALQSATRLQLHAEYQARLDQAAGDVWQLWSQMNELQRRLSLLQAQLPGLQNSALEATRAYQAGQFPAASYLALIGADLAGQQTRSDLLQSLWTDSIALATVLGTQMQPAAATATATAEPRA